MGLLDKWKQGKDSSADKQAVNVQSLLNSIEKYSGEGLVTLTDAAESNTLPATTSTPITSLLQTIRNNLKWLVGNKENVSNKKTSVSSNNDTDYPTTKAVATELNLKAPINATLTDAAESNTLPATASTPITSLLQTIRNCLKWLTNNKENLSNKKATLTNNDTDYPTTKAIINAIYPVGAIFMSANGTNPGTYLSGTTWVAWGGGRVPVGVNTSDGNFNSVEKTGGSNTHTLTTSEMPSHNHGLTGLGGTTSEGGNHSHSVYDPGHKHPANRQHYAGSGNPCLSGGAGWEPHNNDWWYSTGYVSTGISINAGGSHSHSLSINGMIDSTGSGTAHNNLQPYITCYMWKRIS